MFKPASQNIIFLKVIFEVFLAEPPRLPFFLLYTQSERDRVNFVSHAVFAEIYERSEINFTAKPSTPPFKQWFKVMPAISIFDVFDSMIFFIHTPKGRGKVL